MILKTMEIKKLKRQVFMTYFVWSFTMLIIPEFMEGKDWLRVIPLYVPAIAYMGRILLN